MRFADMVTVLSPGRRKVFRMPGLLAWVFVGALWASCWCVAQAQPPANTKAVAQAGQKKADAGQEKGKTKGESASSKAAGDDEDQGKADKKGDEVPGEPPPDPSQTQKVSPVEVFKDPNAEEILDLKKFNPIRKPLARPTDVEAVKAMAQDPNAPVDPTQIRRMVGGMVAQLTDTRNIQGLIDPPPGAPANSPTIRAIEDATSALLEPLFVGRANRSSRFLAEYNRALLTELTPLLKHHLVPRVQAMIVLGQSGNSEALKLFLDEIKNPKQTVWVKLWAIRGISNIKKNPAARLSASQEIDAARVIADLLENDKELPWPVQLRALEAMANLRQGYIPSAPKGAEMATAAMRILADPNARPEVRAEAARALGMMQISSAVPGFNYTLIAYAAAQLAAQLGEQVAAKYSADKGTPLNATKAEYLTALLAGPVYQAFEGQTEVRDSGLLHGNAAAARNQIQGMLDQIKPIVRASLDLIRAPTGQLKARRKDLVDRVATLKEFLAKNAPANRHLVPDDDGFLQAGDSQAEPPAAAQPGTANVAAGARGAK
jgi:hypothetical protein